MKFKDIFTDLRKKAGLSQNGIAEKLFVTRQAVSRWEQGDTVPEIETLQAISKLFHVTINDLLGYPSDLRCQSCGMPLAPEQMGRNPDGSLNGHYCKWCWDNGDFLRDCTLEEMVEQCLPHMPGDPEANRAYMTELLPTLERWKKKEV
ncbi:MAG: helix-turn-helix domain-containing protein [Oscillibacter sp.]|jgi:transcriptional regulator with XRE-family HTH domain|uniref:zinc ribbon domain-containing protein n=1 Tax=uncultured Oscillibacter sp. TaxID=876091 RepID=UPI002173EECB|nr:zinc ribbon domain-containing protein [uncultured Oscillibacter sp.]MCI9644839.1 helix-turn-helix domain-containing protein [Oscillibacter sp.]